VGDLGVTFTNISRTPLVGLWEFLAGMIAVACVITDWANVDEKNSVDVNRGAPLGWVTLVAVNIMLSSDIRQLVPSPAISIVSLILLALFLPVSVSRRICFSAPHDSRATRAAWFERCFWPWFTVLLVGAWHGFWPRRQERATRASDRKPSLGGM